MPVAIRPEGPAKKMFEKVFGIKKDKKKKENK